VLNVSTKTASVSLEAYKYKMVHKVTGKAPQVLLGCHETYWTKVAWLNSHAIDEGMLEIPEKSYLQESTLY